MFTDVFNIESRGTYEATLTDFRFPNPLKITGLNITTARESLGSLQGSGSFTFDAGPGDYYLGFFARAGNHNNHSARGKDKKFQSTANETGNEKSDNSRKVAHRNTRKRSVESEWIPNYRHPYDLKIERMNIGQYGIQVALLEQNSISTPLPGAVWLFISGLLGLTAMVRKRNRKTG